MVRATLKSFSRNYDTFGNNIEKKKLKNTIMLNTPISKTFMMFNNKKNISGNMDMT